MPSTATLIAIMKDERPYLVEWVSYHRLIGFDKMVVYSNDCSDGTDELLDRMQEAGLLRHVRWPSVEGRSAQHSAYIDAFEQCETEWIMSLDADEFLNLAKANSVGDFLEDFTENASAIAICWRIFGSSGQLWRGPQPVTRRFTWAAPIDHYLNRRIKTIARVSTTESIGIHTVSLKGGEYVLPTGEPCKLHRGNFARPRYEAAQVNHYVVRSREEFEAKLLRGNAHMPLGHPEKAHSRPPTFFDEHDRNEERDQSILRWASKLRAEMIRINRLLS